MKVKEIIEELYFETQEEADEHSGMKAVGGVKTINGTYSEEWGKKTTYSWISVVENKHHDMF